jgi:multisubunit Na+/H+ antiporter MnhG subunit
MNKLMFFVLACVTLAVFRAALGLMVVALLLALLFALVMNPTFTVK